MVALTPFGGVPLPVFAEGLFSLSVLAPTSGDGAGPLARFGCEHRALREMRPPRSGSGSQLAYFLGLGTACIGAGQADAAPQVCAARVGKSFDEVHNHFGIGAAYEPDASSQSLIECS